VGKKEREKSGGKGNGGGLAKKENDVEKPEGCQN